jgi:hypothetical protein
MFGVTPSRNAHKASLFICALLALASTTTLAVLAPLPALASSYARPNAATATKGHWGDAQGLRGVVSGASYSQVYSLSCSSSGNCAAGGEYQDDTGPFQAFVVNEKGGKWGNSEIVPGIAALNTGNSASITSVSCRSTGDCSAGGIYENSSDSPQAFVVNEKSGKWGDAETVPGIANAADQSQLGSLSCASAGNCVAGGSYQDASGHEQAFVVSETNGNWANSEEVPGTGSLNVGGDAQVYSVSCPSAGACAAVGDYQNASFDTEVFVASENKRKWGMAVEVPGTATLNAGDSDSINSVSCASAGNCSAGGSYANATFDTEVFVVSEKKGVWARAIELPGIGALNAAGDSMLSSLSCGSGGNCAAGGMYAPSPDNKQVFVANEINGKWSDAIEVPGSASLNAGDEASFGSVSCASASSCAGGGSYLDGSMNTQAFVVNETNGKWSDAIEVPGTSTLNVGGNGFVASVSCPSAGNCGAGGYYADNSGTFQAMVVGSS